MSVTRPITRQVIHPLTSAITASGVGGGGDSLLTAALALSPVLLYDHKDINSFFLDSAMTTPATVGGPVGAVLDKSGNGRHRIQATTALKWTLRQSGDLYYIEADGVDDTITTSAINLTATDNITACFGIRKLSDAKVATYMSVNGVGSNSFYWKAPSANGQPRIQVASRGSLISNATDSASAAPITRVVTQLTDISDDVNIIRIDGAQVASSVQDQGTGNYGNGNAEWGTRSGGFEPFTGYCFGGAIYASRLSGADLAAVEAFVADRTGVTLP